MLTIRTEELPRSVRIAIETAEAEVERRAAEEAEHLEAFERLFTVAD